MSYNLEPYMKNPSCTWGTYKSISTDTLHSRFGWGRAFITRFCSRKMVLSQQFHTRCKGRQKALHCPTSGFFVQIDQFIIWIDLIGPDGLLLVVSHLLQCQFHVYSWGMGNRNPYILDVRFTTGGPHADYGWRCSKRSVGLTYHLANLAPCL